MSRYGESQMDDLYVELANFLQEHPIFELLQIVADVIEDETT